jgi:hypothetical protein
VFFNPLDFMFSCYYQGPLPSTVSSVSHALATDGVQYALKQPVPVMMLAGSNTRQVGTGLIDSFQNMTSNTSMRVLFTDWVYFDGTFVNGVKGTLAYASADGLLLDDITVNVPKALDLNTNAAAQIVQAGVGFDNPIGSTSVPVYWTGSGFATTSLATVASTGSYNDLSNKPTIPIVHNATLTIQKNGDTVNTFTANASTDVTVNITAQEAPLIGQAYDSTAANYLSPTDVMMAISAHK